MIQAFFLESGYHLLLLIRLLLALVVLIIDSVVYLVLC